MRKVIREKAPIEIITLAEIDTDKLYIYYEHDNTPTYKLHRVDNCFAFIRLNDSRCYHSGQSPTAAKAIDVVLKYGYVLEFNSFSEFLDHENQRRG